MKIKAEDFGLKEIEFVIIKGLKFEKSNIIRDSLKSYISKSIKDILFEKFGIKSDNGFIGIGFETENNIRKKV